MQALPCFSEPLRIHGLSSSDPTVKNRKGSEAKQCKASLAAASDLESVSHESPSHCDAVNLDKNNHDGT